MFKVAEDSARKMEKINSDLFVLTYGAFVVQLLQDHQSFKKVNVELKSIGRQIGNRLVEDFFARTNIPKCSTFEECMAVVCEVAFKMFLNLSPKYKMIGEQESIITLTDNPLAEYAVLPKSANEYLRSSKIHNYEDIWFTSNDDEPLYYSNVICGVIEGALDMVQVQVTAEFISDTLLGHPQTEMRILLKKILDDEMPLDDE
eukprot:NODE_78_length_23131_cov_0.599427.p11 type:complete len:202 gc:universal NODE_78_length_23131_cov_0.599427:12414-13019(+)